MSTNFPTNLDTTTELKNDNVDSADIVYAENDNNQSDAILALEAKVGKNASAVTTSLDYQMENHAHTAGTDDGGAVLHASLGSVGTDDHHAQSHGSEHAAGGSDPIVGAPAVRTVGADYFVFKSGSNYIAFRTADGATPYTSTNAASVINSAASVLAGANGGMIQLEPKTNFNCTSVITLGSGVVLYGGRPPSEGNSNTPLLTASSNLGGGTTQGAAPLVKLNGFGASLVGVNIAAGSNATEAVCVNSAACSVWGGFITGGRTRTYGCMPGMARQRVSDVRFDGNSAPATSVVEFYSTDHVVSNIVSTGCAAGGAALIVNGNNGVFSAMHITGDSTSADTMQVIGDGNDFSCVKVDTVGSNGTCHIMVSGGHNSFAACAVENVPDTQTKTPIGIKNVWGTQFSAFEVAGAAGNGTFGGLVKFLTAAGGTPANLANFKGTQIHFAASSIANLGGTLCNVMPTSGNGIWLQGYVNAGTAAGTYNITG